MIKGRGKLFKGKDEFSQLWVVMLKQKQMESAILPVYFGVLSELVIVSSGLQSSAFSATLFLVPFEHTTDVPSMSMLLLKVSPQRKTQQSHLLQKKQL